MKKPKVVFIENAKDFKKYYGGYSMEYQVNLLKALNTGAKILMRRKRNRGKKK